LDPAPSAQTTPPLTTRIDGRRTKDPVRVVLDTRLTIEPDARVINPESSASVVVAAGPDVDPEKAAALGQRGVKLIYPAMDGDRLDLRDLMLKLKQMSVTSLLIEGGGQVASSALKAGIVNKVCWFMAPKFLGGSDGIPVFGGRGPAYIRDAFELKRTGYEQIGQDIMVTGYLDKGREN
jgi:diaminohydroxyphosphoribosylaminopyrimidine deaminase/5-amino-6-(5-phosphoribosylamino)uracil reductase